MNDTPRKILSLDLSISNTGWAFAVFPEGRETPHVDWGDIGFNIKPKERKGMTHEEIQGEQLSRFNDWLRSFISCSNPTEICMEKSFLNTNPSTEILLMIRGLLLVHARKRSIPVTSYATSQLKAHALEKGYVNRYKNLPQGPRSRAIKQEMVDAMLERTGTTRNVSSDIADAYHCLILHIESGK